MDWGRGSNPFKPSPREMARVYFKTVLFFPAAAAAVVCAEPGIRAEPSGRALRAARPGIRPVVRLGKGGVTVYTTPTASAAQRGLIGGPDSVFPLLGRVNGTGCRTLWLRIGPRAYVCSGLARPGHGRPRARTNPHVPAGRMLPRRWYGITRRRTAVRSRPSRTSPVIRYLARGSGVIVRPRIHTAGGTWRRSRLGYIEANRLRFARPSRFKGVHLGGQATLPICWVSGAGARVTRTPGSDHRVGRLDPYTRVTVLETRTHSGKRHARIGPNRWVRADRVRTARPRMIPTGLGPGDKWIHVSLTEWTLVAYQGRQPVYATVVSHGNNTPRGRYRVIQKTATSTLTLKKGNALYEVEGVPWVMYFKPHFAFHAAYWHDLFGYVESHGCVNLSPTDARWLFQWSAPSLPPGWYDIRVTPKDPGTTVVVN